MSDQVEIVAAEDAPSNTESGETEVSVQATIEQPESEQPVASAVESVSENAPVEEKAEEAPLVDGPVGEVLDDSNEDSFAAQSSGADSDDVDSTIEQPESAQPVASAVESVSKNAPVAENVEETPLVDGPVGKVLDDGNEESYAANSPEPDSGFEEGDDSLDADGSKSNVRILAVGQQVQGTIKRIAEFGAFVDIGVGRDGLIHISELSVRRVGKVTDVLAEGQEVTAWIKKLDRDRNRISLTLIDPNTKTIRDLNKDDLVQGTVTRILPYGAFVDIGIGRDALLHVREMGVGYVAKPEDVVKVGDSLEARIIELSRRRGRVDLSLKGLREEPEPTPAPQAAWPAPQEKQSNNQRRQQPEPEPEPEVEDLEDLEVLSPMELAFKRAMEAEGMEMNVGRKKQGKRSRQERTRDLQDDIITRTLSSGRK